MNTITTLQRPSPDDRDAWVTYWQALNQPWRIEPEIDMDRQIYLALHRKITSDIKQGVYPFRDIKLSRADVEWLLATHENGFILWNGEQQLAGRGLDLRGADLRQIDLHGLPLVYMQGGLAGVEWNEATLEQRKWREYI